MAKLGTINFTGKSGKSYAFEYWDFPGSWKAVAGIYIIGVFNRNENTIRPIYVGQTDNLQSRLANHHRQSCFDGNGANVLCWLSEVVEASRLAVETDLVNGLDPTCNR
ncbi:MAG: GIY-YIG nuclease family protein [Chloroflexi bacterium]|nr:GIY-YIG nuclease family protein [Chloroflexota bacterium]